VTSVPASGAPGTPGGDAPASVVVVGTGLIGTSIALALRERGTAVWLADHDPASARLAEHIGAGTVLPLPWPPAPARTASGSTASGSTASGSTASGSTASARVAAGGATAGIPAGPGGGTPADLAVLAVPPAAVAATLAGAQAAGLARWYTDVASVKSLPLAQAREAGCDLSTFVPSHPVSGRERSGPAAARADLFLGRPWAICPEPGSHPAAVAAVTGLARACGAEPVTVSAAEHDQWVALVSHAPHVVSAAMAARLADAPDSALAVAGQGLRDVTRIAGGDPELWTQILGANAAPVARVLAEVAADLSMAAEALADAAQAAAAPAGAAPAGAAPAGAPQAAAGERLAVPEGTEAPAALKALTGLLAHGNAGTSRIPGKRGKPARADAVVQVVIRDQPGELARLFQAAGQAGVNIEDIGIEHSPGLPVGVAELTVRPEAVAALTGALAASGWPVRR
jgi:prephenate dehydrogenase